jgi:hypothetical protein
LPGPAPTQGASPAAVTSRGLASSLLAEAETSAEEVNAAEPRTDEDDIDGPVQFAQSMGESDQDDDAGTVAGNPEAIGKPSEA